MPAGRRGWARSRRERPDALLRRATARGVVLLLALKQNRFALALESPGGLEARRPLPRARQAGSSSFAARATASISSCLASEDVDAKEPVWQTRTIWAPTGARSPRCRWRPRRASGAPSPSPRRRAGAPGGSLAPIPGPAGCAFPAGRPAHGRSARPAHEAPGMPVRLPARGAPTTASTAAGRPTSHGAWPPIAPEPPAATRGAAPRSNWQPSFPSLIAPPHFARRPASSDSRARPSFSSSTASSHAPMCDTAAPRGPGLRALLSHPDVLRPRVGSSRSASRRECLHLRFELAPSLTPPSTSTRAECPAGRPALTLPRRPCVYFLVEVCSAVCQRGRLPAGSELGASRDAAACPKQ